MRKPIYTSGILLPAAALLAAFAAGPAAGATGLTPLGDLPFGGFSSSAFGVSDDGSTVVGSSGNHSFRWTSGGGMQSLGDLSGGALRSIAWGISGDGLTVIGQGESDQGTEAYRWTSSGGMDGLGDMGTGSRFSLALAVNGDGSIVVGRGKSDRGTEAFRSIDGGPLRPLGDLPGGAYFSVALGVSGDGATIFGLGTSASFGEAFRWTSSAGMERLWDVLLADGIDPAAGGWTRLTEARGISADGTTVIGQGTSASGREAFRWTSGGDLQGLGELSGGIFFSQAFGVSGDGSTIVGQSETDSGYQAYRWTSDEGMVRLWDVLLNSGIDPAADGWTVLSSARDISADGTTIVGYGTRNGNTEAFLAVVPEPATLSLLALGSGLALLRRRRP